MPRPSTSPSRSGSSSRTRRTQGSARTTPPSFFIDAEMVKVFITSIEYRDCFEHN